MDVNSNVLLQTRTCEKCGQRQGNIYDFHFGKKLSETSRRFGNKTVYTTKYNVAGKLEAAACNKCIRMHRVIRLVVFGLMITVGAGIALWVSGWDQFKEPARISEVARLQDMTLGVAGILGLIGLWGLIPNLFANKATQAENLIIGLKKRELKKHGFNTFWNTKNFRKLGRR